MSTARRKMAKALDEPFDLQTLSAVRHKLPRGPRGLPKVEALHAQKVRLIHGIAQAVAEKGYAATTVADITAKAGVSRTTFYELFKDKEACYLFGLRSTSGTHLKVVRGAFAPDEHPAGQLVQAIHAFFAFPLLDPAFAKAFIVEADGISSAVDGLIDELRANFAAALKDWFAAMQATYPEIEAPAEQRYELLLAALWVYLKVRVRNRQSASDADFQDLMGFTFSTLGLVGWAKRAKAGARSWGSPLR